MRLVLRSIAFLSVAILLMAAFLIFYPRTPLPDAWNPVRPLSIADPITPLTSWKLRRAHSGAACVAALGTGDIGFDLLEDLEDSDQCHIRDRVRLRALRDVRIAPLETRCSTVLRMALWERHGFTPAAEAILGARVSTLHHLSSYNCRRLRTPGGMSNRMSTHATAEAVDITGVTLDDGRRISLIDDWGTGPEGRFLRAMRDTACQSFATTLGPDFNRLHADHFHLQTRGFGTCR